MTDTTPTPVDYEIELLTTGLASGQPGSGAHWRRAFVMALANWQLDRAQLLLRLVKGAGLDQYQLSVVRYLEAQFLVRQGDWSRAESAYRRALELKRASDDHQGEMAVLQGLGNLLRHTGRPLPESIDLYGCALKIAQELGDDRAQAGIRNSLGLAYYHQGLPSQAHDEYAAALVLAESLDEPAFRASILHNLGSLAWTQGNLDKAESSFEQALLLEQSQYDRHGAAETRNSLGLILEARGAWQDARAQYAASLAVVQTAGDLYGQVQVLANLGNVEWLLGNFEQAMAHQQQALMIAQDLGDTKLEGQILTSLGDTYRSLRQYAAAEDVFLRAVACKEQTGDERGLKHTYLNLGSMFHVLNRLPAAREAYQQARALAQRQQDTRIEAFSLLNLGKLAALEQDQAEAATHLAAAQELAEAKDYRDCLARIAQVYGDLERMKPSPDASRMLAHYVEACAYAADFNLATLEEMLDYLIAVWQAHAEDGYPGECLWFCDTMKLLWREIGYAEQYPILCERFDAFAAWLRAGWQDLEVG